MKMRALLLAWLLAIVSPTWGAVARVGTCTQGFSETSSNVTLSLPTGTSTGHTVIAHGTYPAGGDPQYVTPTDTTGWTQITNAAAQDAATQVDAKYSVWIKTFSGSPPANIEFTSTGGTSPRNMAVQLCAWSGVDATSYAISSFTVDASGTDTSINHPSVTVPSPGGMVVMFGDFAQLAITTRGYPSGYSELAYQLPTESQTAAQYMASNESVAAGATGTLAATFDANGAGKVVFTLAVAAAAGGGGSSPVSKVIQQHEH
jgi:hypothetical protein